MQLRKLLHTLSCTLALVLITACDPPDDPDMPPGAETLPISDVPDEMDEMDEMDDDEDLPPSTPPKHIANAVDTNAIDDDHPQDLADIPHDPGDHPPEDLVDVPHSPTDPPAPSHPEDLTDR